MKITPLDAWIRDKTSASDITAWQIMKLNETLALVRNRSAFYRSMFKDLPGVISDLDEFLLFPFTSSEAVRNHPLKLLCVSQDEISRVVTLQSSGTTGDPKRIFFTAEDQALTIDFFGVGMSTLVEVGERVLILLPGEKPGSVGDLLRLGLERMGAFPIPYGMVRDPIHALDVMENQGADCLVGSPTQILGLARRWVPGHKAPRTVLLSTDYVPAAIARELENIWDCEVFNHYGATEMGLGGGVECLAHRGYHLREADLYFEIVDPETGAPVPDGEYGEVVFSTLTRRGMPLIRYRMGDRSRFITGYCPCGTRLRTMEKVSGRYGGFILAREETLRLPDFDEALFPVPGLLNFTVTLEGDLGKETLKIEAQMLANADASAVVRQALENIPFIKKFGATIHCVCNPNETGSLVKRVILDQRGFHA